MVQGKARNGKRANREQAAIRKVVRGKSPKMTLANLRTFSMLDTLGGILKVVLILKMCKWMTTGRSCLSWLV